MTSPDNTPPPPRFTTLVLLRALLGMLLGALGMVLFVFIPDTSMTLPNVGLWIATFFGVALIGFLTLAQRAKTSKVHGVGIGRLGLLDSKRLPASPLPSGRCR